MLRYSITGLDSTIIQQTPSKRAVLRFLTPEPKRKTLVLNQKLMLYPSHVKKHVFLPFLTNSVALKSFVNQKMDLYSSRRQGV